MPRRRSGFELVPVRFSHTNPQEPDATAIVRMLLKCLAEKGSDADLLSEIVLFAVNQLMALDIESLTGAALGERSALRTNHRNVYPELGYETRVARSRLRSPSFGGAATSTPCWSRAARRKWR